jgi:hypothetical protein
MKISKKSIERLTGINPDDVNKVEFACPKARDCFGAGEFHKCYDRTYPTCEIYLDKTDKI